MCPGPLFCMIFGSSASTTHTPPTRVPPKQAWLLSPGLNHLFSGETRPEEHVVSQARLTVFSPGGDWRRKPTSYPPELQLVGWMVGCPSEPECPLDAGERLRWCKLTWREAEEGSAGWPACCFSIPNKKWARWRKRHEVDIWDGCSWLRP